MILDVSSWLGNKLGIEEKHVRLLFLIAFLFYGVGLGVYIALWVYKVISRE